LIAIQFIHDFYEKNYPDLEKRVMFVSQRPDRHYRFTGIGIGPEGQRLLYYV